MSNNNTYERPERSSSGAWSARIVGLLMFIAGLPLIWGGVKLIAVDGSWYYALAGSAVSISGLLIFLRKTSGVWLYAITFVATIIWALWETGLEFWPLIPRLVAPAVIALLVALIYPRLTGTARRASYGIAAILVIALVATGYYAFQPHGVIRKDFAKAEPFNATAEEPANKGEWRSFGGTLDGTRYASLDQINLSNIDQLERAWTFQTGTPNPVGDEDQNTPLMIGDTVFSCTPRNVIHALNAETGELRWKYDPQLQTEFPYRRCRALGYYEADASSQSEAPADAADSGNETNQGAEGENPDGAIAAANNCSDGRIIMTTLDGEMMAVDAQTGKLCNGFGEDGVVNLKTDVATEHLQFYFQTSGPIVARDMIILGGYVTDNQMVGEPSGVIRAFSAETGELVWAWDLGNPEITKYPPPGETYTLGTPNVWFLPSVDEELGMVYLPTGNATPDFFGGHRDEADDKYSSSIVALNLETGREEWVFQTVHHDIWDLDVPAQPSLVDLPDGTPALLQVTKRGQIFMLDRRDGTPLADVEERPVPQEGGVPEDYLSPTQPYSVGMPSIGTEPLSEVRMWGATPYDQLYCRIQFKKMRYEGEFTPLGLETSLIFPGFFGGMNWGSAAVNKEKGLLIAPDMRAAAQAELIPQAEVANVPKDTVHVPGLAAQEGTPYAINSYIFMSPLGVPCQEPPYGTISAIDLETREVVWQIPAGTVEDSGPLGIKTNLQIPIGMPTLGGPLATSGDLVFYAGTLDYYLRAYNVETGEEVWRDRLPVGAQATPMSYVSPESGRQFILISVGGARQSVPPYRGDYIIAYALPE